MNVQSPGTASAKSAIGITHRRKFMVLFTTCLCLLSVAVIPAPASAATKHRVSGTVTCTGSNRVVGVWIQSSGKGSRWANYKLDPVFKNHATFSADLPVKANVRVDVGCGYAKGSTTKWLSNNSTPSITVNGSKVVSIHCAEKSGGRAVRCGHRPNPVNASVLTRAKSWVDTRVPYNQKANYKNKYGAYRQDCSGFISMAWGLKSSYTTTTLPQVSKKITKAELRPGDILLNTAAGNAGHVVVFVKWANSAKTKYVAYEANGYYGRTLQTTLPYPYHAKNGVFAPYRRA